MEIPILSLLIWMPILASVLIMLMGREIGEGMKWFALLVSVVEMILGVLLISKSHISAEMQFVERRNWIESFDIYYALGADAVSITLIVLTIFMTLIVVIASWTNIKHQVHNYLAAFLLLEGLMVGVFCAMDAMLFYVFFEAMLIPMFLIIGIWGGPRRVYATIKFFLYTFFGSVFMLIALLYLYSQTNTFEIARLYEVAIPLHIQIPIFLAFLIAFAVKVPMWPVHTWLPDAHVEAPTGGSVILAAIMLKIGGYGFLRFNLPITPDASRELDWLLIAMSLIAIVYIGFVALAQKDMKKLIAYSSIAHMGFVTLGFFVIYQISLGNTDFQMLALQGGMIQMISHGFISGALFLCVGVLYDRMHSRNIDDYQGVVNSMPVFAAFMVLFAMANSGLPGTSGFVGEFMVIVASFDASLWYAALAAVTLIVGAAYSLWLVKRVIFGEVLNDTVTALQDVNSREFLILLTLAVMVILLGVWPAPLVDYLQPSLERVLNYALTTKIS
ncbi:MAG: NADH-quinone oxidoreductase subunit M [Gammaproteobacteria bacterium]|nr:NADH-quinone oxidoreductase subunit M [Gammaproteobacteria bacterium]